MPRLLLVDDNQSIHKIVVSLLASTAIDISYAASAAEAFGFIAKEPPFDVMLLDTTLPEMDGWELLGRLRGHPKTAKVPIVMMAGVLEEVDPGKLEDAPIQAFLRKPVDFRDLAERVGEFMLAPVQATEPPPLPQFPSDLLILEEQDLAEDLGFTPFGTMSAMPMASSLGVASAANAQSPDGADEFISLSLEELDLSDMDSLAGVQESQEIPEAQEFQEAPEIPGLQGGAGEDAAPQDSAFESPALPALLPPPEPPPPAPDADVVDGPDISMESAPDPDIEQPGIGRQAPEAQPAPPAEEPALGIALDAELDAAIGTDLDAALGTASDADLGAAPGQAAADYLDTSPEDFGPELFADEKASGLMPRQSHGASSIASELLADPKFIAAVAKAVAKNSDR